MPCYVYVDHLDFTDDIEGAPIPEEAYFARNQGQRIKFKVKVAVAPGNPIWTTSGGGAFDGPAYGSEVIWQQSADWESASEGDVVITATTPDWTVSCRFTVFFINDTSAKLHPGEKRMVVIPDAAVKPAQYKAGRIVQVTDGLFPVNVGDTKGGVALHTRAYVQSAADVLSQALLPPSQGANDARIIKSAEFKYAPVRSSIKQRLYATVEAGTQTGDVNVAWERDGKLVARVHLDVVGCDAAFPAGRATITVNNVVGIDPVAQGGSNANAAAILPTTAMNYKPEVTIHTQGNNALAADYEVGFAQTVLDDAREFSYQNGGKVLQITETPIKDGEPDFLINDVPNPNYDEVFLVPSTAPNAAGTTEAFNADGQTITLTFPDKVTFFAYNDLATYRPVIANNLPASSLIGLTLVTKFRVWVVVRHKPTGCLKKLHHVDWDLDYAATVVVGTPTVVTIQRAKLNVTAQVQDESGDLMIGGPTPLSAYNYLYVP